MLTPEQSRAARGLLDWSQTELAKRSNLSESTIRDFEKGRRVPSENNLAAIAKSFTIAGISLIDDAKRSRTGGPGVRFSAASKIAMIKNEIENAREHLNILDDIRRDTISIIGESESSNKRLYLEDKLKKVEADIAFLKSELSEKAAQLIALESKEE